MAESIFIYYYMTREELLMNPLKIVIADDNKRMVEVIKEVINGEPQLDVVGTATNGEDTVDVIKRHSLILYFLILLCRRLTD